MMENVREKQFVGLGMEPTKNQPCMLTEEIILPLKSGFNGLFEYFTTKAVILATSWPVLLSLELFETPRQWWVGLIYLVIFDWAAGVSRAIYQRRFDIRLIVKKWYSVVVYMIVCGSVAIVSNTFDLLYYFQYVVYFTFYMKEFISILKTFNLLSLIMEVWNVIYERDFSPEALSGFMDKVKEHRLDQEG